MFFKFATLGPITLKRQNGHVTESTFSEFIGDIRKHKENLEAAIGIYIFAAQDASGSLIPWYIGKTDKGFKTRFGQHWKLFSKLSEKAPDGHLQVFLIPRVSSKRESFRKPGEKKLDSIDDLETMLIGSCMQVNPYVLNEKKVSWQKELYVPGYFGDDANDTSNESAVKLRTMLKR